MLRLFIILISTIVIGFLFWFILKNISLVQQSYILSWIINLLSIVVVIFILIVVTVLHFQNQAPPAPEITFGEFPFRLEYEIEGERFIIEDIVFAEFRGSFRGNMTTLPRRSWNIALLNGRLGVLRGFQYEFRLKEAEDVTITFSTGTAGYFMGDGGSEPRITVRNLHGITRLTHNSPEETQEILVEHGIRLISWEHDPPIENNFE